MSRASISFHSYPFCSIWIWTQFGPYRSAVPRGTIQTLSCMSPDKEKAVWAGRGVLAIQWCFAWWCLAGAVVVCSRQWWCAVLSPGLWVNNGGVDSIEEALDLAPKSDIFYAEHACTGSLIIMDYRVITRLALSFSFGESSLCLCFCSNYQRMCCCCLLPNLEGCNRGIGFKIGSMMWSYVGNSLYRSFWVFVGLFTSWFSLRSCLIWS